MDLWQQSGCFEPGNITDAEAAVDADDVFYSEAKRGRRPGGVRAIWLEGAAYRGRPTRVFAWLGVPAGAQPRSLPGMVLVHGGGGTAFATWVHRWVKRGYAAIAIDTCGNLPRGGRCIVLFGCEPSGLHDIGESDALTDGGQEWRRVVVGERLGGFSGKHRAGCASIQHEPRLEFRPVNPRFAE